MAKRWSKTEIAHLKRHAASKTPEELAQRLHTDAPTVRAKLTELGLSTDGAKGENDPALAHFEEGLELLYKKKWKPAAASFEKVVESSDARDLTDRARQHLEVCRRHLAKPVAAEDPFLAAVVEKNAGRFDAALAICNEQDAAGKDERFLYLKASLLALSGDEDAALATLKKAIAKEPKHRVHAYHDSDLESLHGSEAFSQLLAGAGKS